MYSKDDIPEYETYAACALTTKASLTLGSPPLGFLSSFLPAVAKMLRGKAWPGVTEVKVPFWQPGLAIGGQGEGLLELCERRGITVRFA